MQVTETHNESLSRSYAVRVPAAELGALLEARIAEISPNLRLKGFRPGKVPPGHVRRLYGKALMSEVVEKTLNETSQQVLDDNGLRIATQPDLKPSSDMEEVLAGRQDLTYALEVEVMPEFEPTDIAALELTRLVYRPAEAEIDAAVAEVAEQNRTYSPRAGKAAKAVEGDQLLINFIGRIDGEVFEGGSGEGAEIVLGAGSFIPGFEEQLIGAKAGDERMVKVTFPAEYQVERLKGQAAEFQVTVEEVRAPKAAKADDALAVSLGLSDLTALREAVRANLEGEYQGASRFKLKRALLDALDSRHDIPLPAKMVAGEFEAIWRQVKADEEAEGRSPEDEGKSEETLMAEYRRIAERRVRLGLVLAEIGRRENVAVSDQEMTEAMRAQARQYGDMAQRMFEFLRDNPQAQANLRAPLYEEKVVDLIIGRAKVAEKEVSKEVLLAEDELPEGILEAKPKPKPKSAKAKAPSAKAEPKAKAAGPARETPAKTDGEPKAKAAAKPKAAAKEAKPAAKPKAKQ
ncbi:MAG TPA: trigger factor [Caulobacteraceae bacterium]|jgi:trigger factor|nr:trigger factor [Caulobacteraceae bacterium]